MADQSHQILPSTGGSQVTKGSQNNTPGRWLMESELFSGVASTLAKGGQVTQTLMGNHANYEFTMAAKDVRDKTPAIMTLTPNLSNQHWVGSNGARKQEFSLSKGERVYAELLVVRPDSTQRVKKVKGAKVQCTEMEYPYSNCCGDANTKPTFPPFEDLSTKGLLGLLVSMNLVYKQPGAPVCVLEQLPPYAMWFTKPIAGAPQSIQLPPPRQWITEHTNQAVCNFYNKTSKIPLKNAKSLNDIRNPAEVSYLELNYAAVQASRNIYLELCVQAFAALTPVPYQNPEPRSPIVIQLNNTEHYIAVNSEFPVAAPGGACILKLSIGKNEAIVPGRTVNTRFSSENELTIKYLNSVMQTNQNGKLPRFDVKNNHVSDEFCDPRNPIADCFTITPGQTIELTSTVIKQDLTEALSQPPVVRSMVAIMLLDEGKMRDPMVYLPNPKAHLADGFRFDSPDLCVFWNYARDEDGLSPHEIYGSKPSQYLLSKSTALNEQFTLFYLLTNMLYLGTQCEVESSLSSYLKACMRPSVYNFLTADEQSIVNQDFPNDPVALFQASETGAVCQYLLQFMHFLQEHVFGKSNFKDFKIQLDPLPPGTSASDFRDTENICKIVRHIASRCAVLGSFQPVLVPVFAQEDLEDLLCQSYMHLRPDAERVMCDQLKTMWEPIKADATQREQMLAKAKPYFLNLLIAPDPSHRPGPQLGALSGPGVGL